MSKENEDHQLTLQVATVIKSKWKISSSSYTMTSLSLRYGVLIEHYYGVKVRDLSKDDMISHETLKATLLHRLPR